MEQLELPFVERRLSALPMDSLARMIVYRKDALALSEWKIRYGHEFPVYAIVNGNKLEWTR